MPKFETTGADGKTYQVEAESEAAAAQAFDQHFGVGGDDRSGGGLNQRAGSFATGFNEDFLAPTLGAPGDFTAWLGNLGARGVNALTGQETIAPATRPHLGSERIRDFLASTVGRTEPKDTTDRLMRGAGAGVGTTVGGFGVGGALTALGRAPTLARTLMGGPPTPGLTSNVVALNRNVATPGGVVSGAATPLGLTSNLAAGAGGGAGSVLGEGVAKEMGGGPMAQFLASTAGGLLGGVTGAVFPTIPGNAWKAGGAAVRPFTEEGRRTIAGQKLNESATYGAPDLPPSPLGIRPTLGQASNDPGLLSLERSTQQLSPSVQGRFGAQASDNNQALLDAFDRVGQPGTRAPYQISQQAATGLEANRATARTAEGDLWRAIDPDRAVNIPMQPIRDRMNAYVNDLTMARRPLVPDDILAMVNRGGDTLPMRELQDLRSALTSGERMARAAGDFNKANIYREMDEALFQRLPEGQVPMPTTADQAATLRYQKALDASKEYQQTFGARPIRDVFKVEGTPDSAVLDKMLAPGQGQAERVGQYVRASMQDPGMLQHGRDWFTAKFKEATASARQAATGEQQAPNFVLGSKLSDFVDNNRALINSPMFTADQRRVIHEMVDAATMVERTARSGPQGGSDTAAKLAGKNYIQAMVGGWFQPARAAEVLGAIGGGMATGGYGGMAAGAVGANRIASPVIDKVYAGARDKVQELLTQAMLDPAFAKELMTSAAGKNTQFASPRMKLFLATLPATVGLSSP